MFDVSQQFLMITHNANLIPAWMYRSMSVSCQAVLSRNMDPFKTHMGPIFPGPSIYQKLGLSREYLEAGYCRACGLHVLMEGDEEMNRNSNLRQTFANDHVEEEE